MSAADAIDAIGAALLRPGAPALARCEALEDKAEPDVRVFLAASHRVVDAVLRDEARFSLEQYDRLLAQVAGETRYFVGADTSGRRTRLAMLFAAQTHLARERGAPAEPSPQLAAEYRAWIATVAREEARAVLAILARRRNARRHTAAPVNFVREYAFLVAYRMAQRVIGVPGPAHPPLFVRVAIFVRNLLTRGSPVTLDGEFGATMSMLELQRPLFGHVFGTVVRSPGWLVTLTRWTTAQALAQFDAALATPETAPRLSLVRGLAAVRDSEFADIAPDEYRSHARSILFELTGALVLIVGNAIANCAAFAASPEGADAGADWASVIAALADDGAPPTVHDAVINELLRLNGGNRLIRTVAADTTFEGVAVRKGDRVVALVNFASRDAQAFPDPGRFAPDPARPYLTSGPFGGPHVCYGRFIAWTVLREALVEAARMLRPRPGARLESFAGLPDAMAWEVFETSSPKDLSP